MVAGRTNTKQKQGHLADFLALGQWPVAGFRVGLDGSIDPLITAHS